MAINDGVRFTSSPSLKLSSPERSSKPRIAQPPFSSQSLASRFTDARNSLSKLVSELSNRSLRLSKSRNQSLLCSSTLALVTESQQEVAGLSQQKSNAIVTSGGRQLGGSEKEERVLISEVLVRNKDGEELARKDLEAEAVAALKASRPNSALTVREVQEDVLRIINSGYFCSCLPVAVDTRDGIRLVFQVSSWTLWM